MSGSLSVVVYKLWFISCGLQVTNYELWVVKLQNYDACFVQTPWEQNSNFLFQNFLILFSTLH